MPQCMALGQFCPMKCLMDRKNQLDLCHVCSMQKKGIPRLRKRDLHVYLVGNASMRICLDITLQTDHQPLISLFNESKPIPSNRIQRWALTLSSYQYTIACWTTQQHVNADAMSWLPFPEYPTKDLSSSWICANGGKARQGSYHSCTDSCMDPARPNSLWCASVHSRWMASFYKRWAKALLDQKSRTNFTCRMYHVGWKSDCATPGRK